MFIQITLIGIILSSILYYLIKNVKDENFKDVFLTSKNNTSSNEEVARTKRYTPSTYERKSATVYSKLPL